MGASTADAVIRGWRSRYFLLEPDCFEKSRNSDIIYAKNNRKNDLIYKIDTVEDL
jgi:hypothetical protein